MSRTVNKKLEKLMREAHDADGRVQTLATELRGLPGRIQEAAREEARAGAGGAATATVSELARLRDREASLPLELWGARIARMEASVELQKAQLAEIQSQQEKALAEREETEAEYQLALGRRDEAAANHSGLGFRQQNIQRQLKNTERELQELEAQGPPSA